MLNVSILQAFKILHSELSLLNNGTCIYPTTKVDC